MRFTSDVTLRTYFQSVLQLLFIAVLWNQNVNATCLQFCHCLPLLKSWQVTCASRNLKTVPEGFNQTVHTLDLFNNSIQFVSFQYHHYPELRILNLSKNKILRIHHLKTLANLQELNLSENSIQSFGAVHELAKLKILNLSRNPFKLLDTLRNEGLTHLIADECEISFINPTSLIDLPKLLRLSLKRNPIKLIKSPSNVNLRSLDLSHCEIMFLDENTFVDLPSLEELILQNNSQLGQYQYNGLSLTHKKLQILDASECNIKQCSFIELPELKRAILTNNKVSSINNDLFRQNANLEIVKMNKNRIKYIDSNALTNLENLQILDLSYNLIGSIDGTTFASNYRLDILNLSFNALEDVAGLNAPHVRNLDLSNNEMRYFDRNQFVTLPRLQHLNLSNNVLEEFPRLSDSMNLETLDLRRNRISNISESQILSLVQLNTLILSENELEELLAETFGNNVNLTVLDLSRNPWDCDCDKLRSLYFYLSTTDNSSLDKTMCFTPMEKRGYTWQSACILEWIEPPQTSRPPKTLSFIIVTLLLFIVISGSVVSVRHTIKMRRIERNRQIEAERTEIRERLRRLQRRNQQLEEEAMNHLSEQIINPLELAGPPSYEEAVDMARLTRSLDTLNSLGTENTPVTQALGSVDNLRSKRRPRRPKKKTLSDDSLTKRESRREIRLKRDRQLRQNSSHVIDEGANQSLVTANRDRHSVSFNLSHSSSEQIDSSDLSRQRPPTPISKKKKRPRLPTVDATTDDEASNDDKKQSEVTILNLRFEPRRLVIDD